MGGPRGGILHATQRTALPASSSFSTASRASVAPRSNPIALADGARQHFSLGSGLLKRNVSCINPGGVHSHAQRNTLLRAGPAQAEPVAAPAEDFTPDNVQSKAYPFTPIEAKWQKHWLENKTFRTPEKVDTTKPKYFVLDMFPYPRYSTQSFTGVFPLA